MKHNLNPLVDAIEVVEDMVRNLIKTAVQYEDDVVITTWTSKETVKYSVIINKKDSRILNKRIKEMRRIVHSWSDRFNFHIIVEFDLDV